MFYEFIERILGHEGGYVNHPDDPGGETQWGISKRSYPSVDIKKLQRVDAIEIYKKDFWERIHGDEMPKALAFQALDSAVNSGIARTVRWLQKAAGVTPDGYWGPVTREAIKLKGEADMVLIFNGHRLEFMTQLDTWSIFGKGWARRIAANLMYAARDN